MPLPVPTPIYHDGGRKMSDDKRKTGPADRSRINLSEDYEVRYWSETLGVSNLELQAAVEKVGPMVEDVRQFLRKS
jgi:hypothetical protein